MNIFHLEASPGWGGQEIRILHEAEGMRSRGHNVILGVMKGGQLIARARNAGFIVYELNFRRTHWFSCLLQLLWILFKHRIDLINTHSSLDSWIGGIAGRMSRKKIIRTRHLSTPIKKGWNSRFVYGKLADFVVTTCSSIIPTICEQSGKKNTQCCCVATGVDSKKISFTFEESQNFRQSIGVSSSDLLVGTACFMRSWKGIDDFLKTADLLRAVDGIKWVIIGGGHADTYKALARELKLDHIVHFSGHLDNPFPALGALDLFALLSTANEGVSQAILQAAYLQKPLIATPTGGLCQVCIDGVTGIQVPPFSPNVIAQAVLKLKNDLALRDHYGRNGRQLVEREFTLVKTLDKMEEIYYSLRSNGHCTVDSENR